jgi:hypothetical protein
LKAPAFRIVIAAEDAGNDGKCVYTENQERAEGTENL